MPCFAICESTLALTTYSVLVLAVTAHETRPCRRLTASCSCRHPLLSTRLLRSAGLVTGIAPVPFDQKPSCIQWSSPPAHHCSTCSSAACRSFSNDPSIDIPNELVAGDPSLEFADFCEAPGTCRLREAVPQLDRCHNSSALGFLFRESLCARPNVFHCPCRVAPLVPAS